MLEQLLQMGICVENGKFREIFESYVDTLFPSCDKRYLQMILDTCCRMCIYFRESVKHDLAQEKRRAYLSDMVDFMKTYLLRPIVLQETDDLQVIYSQIRFLLRHIHEMGDINLNLIFIGIVHKNQWIQSLENGVDNLLPFVHQAVTLRY